MSTTTVAAAKEPRMTPEAELAAVSSRLLRELRDSDMDYAWALMVPSMVRFHTAAPKPRPEGRDILPFLRRETYRVAEYKAAAYKPGTKPEEIDPEVVRLWETKEQSPAFESAVTYAGKAAVVVIAGVWDITREKDPDNGRHYIVAPYNQVHPTRNLGGRQVKNTDKTPYRLTVGAVNRAYAKLVAPKGRQVAEREQARAVSHVTALASLDNPDTRKAVAAAMRENLGPVADLIGEAARAVKDIGPETAKSLDKLVGILTAVLARTGMQNAAKARGKPRKLVAA